MRKDPKKGADLQKSASFEASSREAAALIDRSSAGEHSLSGFEPNRFFMNLGGKQFDDLSYLSGMAHVGDGRSVVRWDFDHDGWQDIACIHANAPKLLWYRNQLGDLIKDRHFLALQFRGSKSNRDGYGVRIKATFGGKTIVKETRCGEGFSAQQSNTLVLGLGTESLVTNLSVRWPSGTEQNFSDIDAGQLVLIQEDQAAPTVTSYH